MRSRGLPATSSAAAAGPTLHFSLHDHGRAGLFNRAQMSKLAGVINLCALGASLRLPWRDNARIGNAEERKTRRRHIEVRLICELPWTAFDFTVSSSTYDNSPTLKLLVCLGSTTIISFRGNHCLKCGLEIPIARSYIICPSGRGSAWLERCVRDAEVGGSNPLAPTLTHTASGNSS